MKTGSCRTRNHFSAFLCIMLLLIGLIFNAITGYAAPEGKGVSSGNELNKAIADGETSIYLTSNFSWHTYFDFNTGKSYKLDLNGHTITMNSDGFKRSCIRLTNATELTICDTSADQEGCIRDGYNMGSYGGIVCVKTNSKLILESGSLRGGSARDGGGVGVYQGTFIMNGGSIFDNFAVCSNGGVLKDQTGNGCGVWISKGTFVMNGGSIRSNRSGSNLGGNGGGVYVDKDATFTLKGGYVGDRTISSTFGGGNYSIGRGGGVFVKGGGTFNYEGGIIDSNYCSLDGGGIYLDEGSSFTIKEGLKLTANRTNDNGAAIYINNANVSEFKNIVFEDNQGSESGGAIAISDKQSTAISITGCTFNNNIASEKGGAICAEAGTITIENTKITNNRSNIGDGGGIYAGGNSVFSIKGGELTGNEANGGTRQEGKGGALCLKDKSSITLIDVPITINKACHGGGIYIGEEAKCIMMNGTVKNNGANYYKSEYTGGGVMVYGKFEVGGKTIISDNTQINGPIGTDNTVSNVLLDQQGADKKIINIRSQLAEGSQIGVRVLGSDASSQVTSGYGSEKWDNWRKDPGVYFTSDKTGIAVQKNPNYKALDPTLKNEAFLMNQHVHNLSKVVAVAATCKDYGNIEHYKCTVCDRLFKDSEGKKELKNIIPDGVAVDDNNVCDNESLLKKNPMNHVGEKVNQQIEIISPTCLKKGSRTYNEICTSCNGIISTKTLETNALGHDWQESTVDGRKKWECSRCHDVIWGNKADCTHKNTDGSTAIIHIMRKDQTCTECGTLAHAYCTLCETTFRDDESEVVSPTDLIIAPLGHNPDTGWKIDEETRIPALCEQDGQHNKYKECTRCHKRLTVIKEIDPALGHDFSEEPYIDEHCNYIHFCTRGDAAFTVGAMHDPVLISKKLPSCTGEGHEAYYVCRACKAMLDYDALSIYDTYVLTDYEKVKIEPTGHSFDDNWMVETEPTAESTGTEYHLCKNCGLAEKRDIDLVTYRYATGNDSVWQSGESGVKEFIVKRSYKDDKSFTDWFKNEVRVDGKTLKAEDYTAESGSVKVKVKDIFLNTLAAGKHIITIVFKDAEVDASFTVKEAAKKEDPQITDPISEQPAIDPSTEETTEKKKVNTKKDIDKLVIDQKGEKDLKGSNFALLMAKGVPLSKNSIKLIWKKVPGASEYLIYGNKCGKKNKYKRITSVKTKFLIRKKLKVGTYYKHLIVAIDKNGKILATSKTIHCVTNGGKNGNNTKVILSKKSVTLAKKKSVKITAKLKTIKPVRIHRDIAWETGNPKVAKVDNKGKIKAVGKGTCYIYAYAQNGVYAKVKVTVK